MSSGECEKSKTMRLKTAYNPKAGSNRDKRSGKLKAIIPKRTKAK